jgi:uncharacterized membrane protein YecN with MAPEG domain
MSKDVSAVIWNWRERLSEGESGPAPHEPLTGSGTGHRLRGSQVRRQATVQGAVMAVVGVLLGLLLGHWAAAWVIWILAAVILVLGLAHPPAYRPVHAFGLWLGRIVGVSLTWLLLAPFYYLFVTAVAWLLRLRGRDPLHRGSRPPDETYWIPRRLTPQPESYRRQYLREDPQAHSLRRSVREAGAGGSANLDDETADGSRQPVGSDS